MANLSTQLERPGNREKVAVEERVARVLHI